HYEYHAGYGSLADSRNRDSQGAGSDSAGDQAAVSDRGGVYLADWGSGGRGGGSCCARISTAVYLLCDPDQPVVGGDCSAYVGGHWGDFRDPAGESGGADGPGGIAEIRVSGASLVDWKGRLSVGNPMSSATPLPISMSEYLRSSYEPDCDYVDGIVAQRNAGSPEQVSV